MIVKGVCCEFDITFLEVDDENHLRTLKTAISKLFSSLRIELRDDKGVITNLSIKEDEIARMFNDLGLVIYPRERTIKYVDISCNVPGFAIKGIKHKEGSILLDILDEKENKTYKIEIVFS